MLTVPNSARFQIHGASIRHRHGTSKTRVYIYTPSAIQSSGLPQGPLGPSQLTSGATHYAGT